MNQPRDTQATRPKQAPQLNRSRILFGGALAFILAAGLTAMLMSRGGTSTATETATIAVSGSPLPAAPEDPAVADPAVGAHMPVLTGSTPRGKAITIPTAQRRTLVVVVAHWCPHCQREVPRIVEWYKSGNVPADLDVVFLSTSVQNNAPNYPPSAWLAKAEVPYPIIVDDANGTGHQALGGMGFPNLHLVGADGTVIARTSGELELPALAAFAAQS
jgi:cytochrome c biogenesis protein CcmG, thiol:disulfide interchange protein DsbE